MIEGERGELVDDGTSTTSMLSCEQVESILGHCGVSVWAILASIPTVNVADRSFFCTICCRIFNRWPTLTPVAK